MMWVDVGRARVSGLIERARGRGAVRVFCYHGVVEKVVDPLLERNFTPLARFLEHVQLLKRVRVLSLDELADWIERPSPGVLPAAVITFDDGYANNLIAAEVLRDARLPAAVFVSTGPIGGHVPIWTIELALLLLRGRADRVDVLGSRWSLATRAEREQAFASVRVGLKERPSELRRAEMDALRHQFPADETSRTLGEVPSFRMLSWKEVGQLASSDVTIGGHGVWHELHHEAQRPDTRVTELRQGKSEIEARLGRPCVYFAFPNGTMAEASAGEAKAAGYRLGFTTRRGAIAASTDKYRLPRFLAPVSARQLSRAFSMT
jgi:peptidoglycan/xylan/chitin deacetylase (PgdA/CDA1 family)